MNEDQESLTYAERDGVRSGGLRQGGYQPRPPQGAKPGRPAVAFQPIRLRGAAPGPEPARCAATRPG
jgi:hypothetical protein